MKHLNMLLNKPERVFLFFAIPFGLIMVFLIAPLGGTDEIQHYQRIASIANLQLLNKPFEVSSGIADFIKFGNKTFYAQRQTPFFPSAGQWSTVFSFQNTAETSVVQPEPATIHHPFSYIPQIFAFRLGMAAGLTPLLIMYLVRTAGLAGGIALTFFAIRRAPSGKYALTALALLPGVFVCRSYINGDVILDGMAFLFVATVMYETTQTEKISKKNIAYMAAMAFILAQCKCAYLLLSCITYIIPEQRFVSRSSRLLSLAAIIIPGAIGSIAWMLIIKYTYFAGASYLTLGGMANPDMQMAYILHQPTKFLEIYLQNIFLTPMLPRAFLEIIGCVGPGYFLSLAVIILLFFLLIAIILSEKNTIAYSTLARLLATAISLSGILMIIGMVYIDWSGLKSDVIAGFQGRYIFPFLPFALLYIKAPSKPLLSFGPKLYIIVFATLGLSLSLWKITTNYY